MTTETAAIYAVYMNVSKKERNEFHLRQLQHISPVVF